MAWTRARPAPEPPPEAPAESEIASRALPLVLDRLGTRAGHRILDLGPAVGANVALLSQFGCKLFIADLLGAAGPGVVPGGGERRWRPELPGPEEGSFDLILAWDLLDHLPPADISTLAVALGELSEPGAWLYALVSTRGRIASRPARFRMAGPELLAREPLAETRPSPALKEPALRRHLPGFSIETSFLLRNGLQEYVFSFAGESPEGADGAPR